jgi:hypothetical protein
MGAASPARGQCGFVVEPGSAMIAELNCVLIELYVQQNEAKRTEDRAGRMSCMLRPTRRQRKGRRSAAGVSCDRPKQLFGRIQDGKSRGTHGETTRARESHHRPPRPGRVRAEGPVIRNTLFAAARPLPACRSRIRFARNGILARVAFPLFVHKPQITSIRTDAACTG